MTTFAWPEKYRWVKVWFFFTNVQALEANYAKKKKIVEILQHTALFISFIAFLCLEIELWFQVI